jgi:hypothetical protein
MYGNYPGAKPKKKTMKAGGMKIKKKMAGGMSAKKTMMKAGGKTKKA